MKFIKQERLLAYEKAISLIHEGYSLKSASEEVGVKVASLRRHLKVNGIVVPSRGVSNIENRYYEDIRSRYVGGESSVSIAKQYGCSDDTILRLLRNLGVEIAGKNDLMFRRGVGYSIDKNAFKDTSTEKAAYFSGWLITDGNVSDRGRVSLELQEQDDIVLKNLKEYLNLSNNIYYRSRFDKRTGNTYKGVTLYFSNAEVVDTLRRLNIVPRKSLKEVCPEVFKYNRHFWRGAIEGDGHISYRKSYSLFLYGSEDFTNSFKTYVESLGVTAKVKRSTSTGMYMCVVSSRDRVKIVLDHLYKDCTLYLPRKYEVYKEYYGEHY